MAAKKTNDKPPATDEPGRETDGDGNGGGESAGNPGDGNGGGDGADNPGDGNGGGDGAGTDVKTTITVRQKTPFESYRCAGLILSKTPATVRVSDAQLARLRRDYWLEFPEEPGK